MNDWGGAQWLIIFMFATRAVLGLARATGKIICPEPTTKPGKVGEFLGARLGDALLAGLLIWGGFF